MVVLGVNLKYWSDSVTAWGNGIRLGVVERDALLASLQLASKIKLAPANAAK